MASVLIPENQTDGLKPPLECQSMCGLPPVKIHKNIPDGLRLDKNKYGIGVFTTRAFKKGESMYKGNYDVLEPSEAPSDRKIFLSTQYGEYNMNVETHTVALSTRGERAVYYFDGYMNHSCDANSYSISLEDTPNGGTYLQVACKDIAAGEEITCDYDLFEWDAKDKGIETCACGAESCRGSCLGFKFLSHEKQCEMLGNVTSDCLLEKFLQKNPNIFYRRVAPPKGWKIDVGKHGYGVIALQDFKKGETLFNNSSELLNEADYNEILVSFPDPTVPLPKEAVEDKKKRQQNKEAEDKQGLHYPDADEWPKSITKVLAFEDHTVKREGAMREFYGFDTFCSHSCDPNCINIYEDEKAEAKEEGAPKVRKYKAVAIKDIKAGEELTCDYCSLPGDSPLDDTVFTCECGAQNCKGKIYG